MSNESIGLSLGAYQAAFELALEPERSRLWVWHVAQLSGDPVPNRSSACEF